MGRWPGWMRCLGGVWVVVAFMLIAATAFAQRAKTDVPAEPAPDAGAQPATTADTRAEPAHAPVETTPEPSADAVNWAARDRAVNESNTLSGGIGLLRTQHAEIGEPGQFRLGFVAEWFSAGFLCTPQYPCPALVAGGTPFNSDSLDHTGGTISLGVSIVKLGPGTLEGYAATTAYANSDTRNRPSLLQVLGDTDLGVKYALPLGDVFRLGAFTELWLINGSGSVGLDGNGTSAKFALLGTADLRGLASRVPLRFSANVVYSLDNTAAVLGPTEAARRQPVTRIERYGLGVNRVDHVDLLLGGEALLLEQRIRPFVEARILIPNNRQRYRCDQANPSHDDCLFGDSDVPSVLTLGARFLPWKRGFSLLAAVDIGMTGTANFIEELQPVAPWTLYLGAGWAVDTWEKPPVIKTVEHQVEVVRTVHVVGFVHEKDKNDPVADAIVSYAGPSTLSPLATGSDGKFADDVPPGAYTYEIREAGYKTAACNADATKEPTVTGAGSEVDVDCPLEALPRVGVVLGHVRDADTGQAVAAVQVSLTDAQRKESRLATDSSGGFRFEGVAPGTAELSVVVDGYLALVNPTDVKARQESTVDLLLRPTPKQPRVQVTAKEITIREQIQFALDSAVILPQSFGILTEVADSVIRHPEILRLEVQGHTDNSGTPDHNRALSDERAAAVRSWLVQHGVADGRLIARGYGQDNPLVPNVTAGNRARNRRVQFVIVDRGSAGNDGGAAPVPGQPRKPNPLPGF